MSNKLTLIKPVPGTEGEPIKAEAWKNIAFLKDGRSMIGVRTWPTEADARAAQNMREAQIQRHGKFRFRGVDGFSARMYSHAIQIPWRAT